MSFNPTLQELIVEIQEAERLRDDHLRGINNTIREYTGRWYRPTTQAGFGYEGEPNDEHHPEPFSYSFVSNMLPQLIYRNPAIAVQARRVMGHREIAEAQKSGIEGLMDDIKYSKEVELSVLDMLFFHGILMHLIEDDTRWSNGAVRPNAMRIDPKHWGCDSLATHKKRTAFEFHDYMVDLDDVMADPAVIPEALERLTPTDGDKAPGSVDDAFERGNEGSLRRKRVKLYSVWLRERNTIRVICKDPMVELYEERPYYGEPTGPYVQFGAYPVPDQVYPLSPLIAVRDQVKDLNVHARAASRSAAGRKTVIIVDGQENDLEDKIHDAEDREVISIPGFNAQQLQQVELGGVTPNQYEYLGLLRDRLDRNSGLTELARGNVGGADTATEASIAEGALNQRNEYLKQKVHEAVAESLHKLGWFLFHTPGIIIPITQRDPMTGMETEGLFFGGVFPGDDAGSWDDYQIRIEPYSMQRVSEALLQRRAMDLSSFIMQVGQMMPMMPYVRWLDLVRMVGEAFNYNDADRFFVPEMLGMMARPELMPPGTMLPATAPTDRYSIPGQGFDPMQVAGKPTSNAPFAVDEMRSELNRDSGREYGGRQGPPGSKSGLGMRPF